jgi:hypothetical protein
MKTVWLFGALSLAISVAGDARADEVPAESGDPHAEAPLPTKWRSPGLAAGGVVMVSVGGLSALLGGVFLIGQDSVESSCRTSSEVVVEAGFEPYDCEKNPADTIAGAALLAGGIALLGGGIPMIVIGKERVPDPLATVSFKPRASGASVGLNVSF